MDGAYLDWKYLNNTRTAPATGVTTATVTLTALAAGTTCHARLFAVRHGVISMLSPKRSNILSGFVPSALW